MRFPRICVILFLYLFDNNLDTVLTNLHNSGATHFKSRSKFGGAIGSGGGGKLCACGTVGCHGGALGKSAHGDGAPLCADEHGFGGDGEDAILFALMLLGAGNPAEGEGGDIGILILFLGGVGGDGVGGMRSNSISL